MSTRTSTTDPAVRKFWDRYINQLANQGIKDQARRWYVIHVERYLKAFPTRRLATHGPNEVHTYLQATGRNPALQDWQVQQVVDAIQKLFAMLRVDWFAQVGWDYWKDATRTLQPTHPTVVRELPLVEGMRSQEQSAGVRVDDVWSEHSEVLAKLVSEIRRRAYSIRTEQAYEAWVVRFIAF